MTQFFLLPLNIAFLTLLSPLPSSLTHSQAFHFMLQHISHSLSFLLLTPFLVLSVSPTVSIFLPVSTPLLISLIAAFKLSLSLFSSSTFSFLSVFSLHTPYFHRVLRVFLSLFLLNNNYISFLSFGC